MKAVILAGGLGTRMREETEYRPKPMVEIGGKPILWHIMKILSAQGLREFVICTGYKAEIIQDYFLNYQRKNHDFTVQFGEDNKLILHGEMAKDELEWTVTVAQTGALTPTGGRLLRVKEYVEGERFLVTYGDGIANVDFGRLVASHEASGCTATITSTFPTSRFGVVKIGQSGRVLEFKEKPRATELVNIGYMIMEPAIFELLDQESVLETEPLIKLSSSGLLNSYFHDGFWQPMGTIREAEQLNVLWAAGAPWRIW